MTQILRPTPPPAAVIGGVTESGLFLPPGVGLGGLTKLPGAANDTVPTPPEELKPGDFARRDCKYCTGSGETKKENKELRVTEVVLCQCVEKRLASNRGPRSKRGQEIWNRGKMNARSEGEKKHEPTADPGGTAEGGGDIPADQR